MSGGLKSGQKLVLLRAAELLEEDAEAGRESCEGELGQWTCKSCERDDTGRCSAQRAHDERMLIAAALKRLGAA